MISKWRPKSGRALLVCLSSLVIITLILTSAHSKAESSGEKADGQLKPQECHSATSTLSAHCRRWPPHNQTHRPAAHRSAGWLYDRHYRTASEQCRKSHAAGLQRVDESGCYQWRYKYIDEQHWRGHQVKVVDKSIDERVANSLYTAISVRIVNMDFFAFASGDREQDELSMRSLEGPQVDERRCGEQLGQLLELLDEFGARLEMKRKNASFELGVEPKHIHLARVLDSFGHYESGLFLGKTHALGGFDQCITSRLMLPRQAPSEEAQRQREQEQEQEQELEMVNTRYCWARMELDKHLSAELRDRKPGQFEAQEKVLMVGTCLPESCHSRSFLKDGRAQTQLNRRLAQRLVDTQFQLPKSLFIDQSLAINTISCLPDGQSDYGPPLMGKLALYFIVGWSLLACYATYHQEMAHRPAQHKRSDDVSAGPVAGNSWPLALFDCLNLKRSWQDFVEEPYEERKQAGAGAEATPARKVNLDVLNPIKTFGAGFVVLGHAVVIQAASSIDYMRSYNSIENDPGTLAMILGTVIVDTFFVITGVLMGYVAMRKSSRVKREKGAVQGEPSPTEQLQNGRQQRGVREDEAASGERKASQTAMFFKHWAKFAIQRHLRLIPLFFLVYWFKRSYLIYTLSMGMPLLDPGFNKDTLFGACKQESWLTPFTMMTGFLPLSKQCLPQTWSVAADLFFSIVVTPIVLVLTKRPKLGLALVGLTILVSHAMTLHAYYSIPLHMATELAQVRAHGFVLMFGYISHLYTYPHFRLTSVLVGVAVGYLLHLYQEAEKPQWPQWLRGWATKASFAIILALFASIATVPETKGYLAPHERLIFTHQFTTGRIIWAVCNGILIIRMSTDWKDSFLMKQFAAPYWSKLVKLNFGILLLHLDALTYQMGSATVVGHFSKLNIFVTYAATYLFCIPLAILLHVLFENPVDKLVRRHVLPRILP